MPQGWPAPPRGLPLGRAHPRRHDRARPAQPGACVRSARGAAAAARPGRARTRRGRRRRAGPTVRSRPRRRSAWRLVLVGLQGPRPRLPPAHLARRGRCRPLPASSAPTCGGAGSTPAASRARCSSLAAHLASFSSGCAVMSWSVRVVLCSSARTVPSGPDNSEPNGGFAGRACLGRERDGPPEEGVVVGCRHDCSVPVRGGCRCAATVSSACQAACGWQVSRGSPSYGSRTTASEVNLERTGYGVVSCRRFTELK